MSSIQIVGMNESILQYFFDELDLQNECEQLRIVKMKEFKEKLTEALNCDDFGRNNKIIEWRK